MDTSFLSGPQVSEIQWKEEQANLGHDERIEVERDLLQKPRNYDNEKLLVVRLEQLELELNEIPNEEKEELIEAQCRGSDMTNDREDRVLFLRSEDFDARKAAQRMVVYWRRRVELFGDKLAYTPLSLDCCMTDCDDDQYAASMHFVNAMPEEVDVDSPSILCFDIARKKLNYSRKSMRRVVWCIFHQVLYRQEKGKANEMVILVLMKYASVYQFDRKLVQMNFFDLTSILPVKITSVHLCHPPRIFEIILPGFLYAVGKRFRQRLLIHSGSSEFVLSRLASFKIRKESLPVELGGELMINTDGSFGKLARRKRSLEF